MQGGEPRQDRGHHPGAGVWPGERPTGLHRGPPAEPASHAAVGAAFRGTLLLLALHRPRVIRRVEEEDPGGARTGDNDFNFHE